MNVNVSARSHCCARDTGAVGQGIGSGIAHEVESSARAGVDTRQTRNANRKARHTRFIRISRMDVQSHARRFAKRRALTRIIPRQEGESSARGTILGGVSVSCEETRFLGETGFLRVQSETLPGFDAPPTVPWGGCSL